MRILSLSRIIKMQQIQAKAQGGMTLLEVLVALAIFAVAAMSVFRAVGMHIQTLSYLEEKTFASMVVDNQLALMQLDDVSKSVEKGETQMAGRTWYWTQTPVKTAVDYIQAIDMAVASDPERKKEILAVRTYVVPDDDE